MLRISTWFGVVLVLFAGYSLWGTGFQTRRSQTSLVRTFEAEVAKRAGATASPTPIVRAAPLDRTPPAPPTGEAVALLKIPKIGLHQAVVQGVTFGALAKGPGHYDYTPLPGEPGNAAIAGHRTTFGAPFFLLDELAVGDEIFVTTLAGPHRFRVTESKVVSPSDRSVLRATDVPSLTLTTCHPAYRASERLVIRAVLAPEIPVARIPIHERDAEVAPSVATPLVPPPAEPAPTPVEPAIASTDRLATVAEDDRSAPMQRAAVALLTSALLWAAYLRLTTMNRRWVRLLLVPALAAALVLAFDSVNALLPSMA